MSIVKEYGGLAVAAASAVAVLYWLGKRSATAAVANLEAKREALVSSIGETVHDWFYPQYRRPMYSYPVYFSGSTGPHEGRIGAVNSEEIDDEGYFTYWRDGSRWRIAGTTSGKLIAIPADQSDWAIQP